MLSTIARPWILIILLTFLPLLAQQEKPLDPAEPLTPSADIKLPNGKSQREEILKADYEKTLKDAAELVQLSQSLQEEIEKDTRHVLSLTSLKKTEEIEKLARRIRSRMRRF
ncbi:MAG: hypothetical protein M3Z85_22715 [Acidobacteriota bacterium]|nr:hypothetical protein [Acidobacteriota bacterium]